PNVSDGAAGQRALHRLYRLVDCRGGGRVAVSASPATDPTEGEEGARVQSPCRGGVRACDEASRQGGFRGGGEAPAVHRQVARPEHQGPSGGGRAAVSRDPGLPGCRHLCLLVSRQQWTLAVVTWHRGVGVPTESPRGLTPP